ncbi:MAG: prepilin-type N-terminal cleavage/methylation domain-containing protein [Candidatus Omnitrophota bacterium]|nr:prepilin-type N-terminal cleavage/methylation domain-containing protein [Candidatus Omnitrophota bacterium]
MTRKAFTLIEVIIATLILAVVVVSIYSAFSIGLKAWKKGSEGGDFQKIRVSLLKMQKELRSSFYFSEIPFKGASSEFAFPLVIPAEDKYNIYKVEYRVKEDAATGAGALLKRKTIFTDKGLSENEGEDEFIFSAGAIGFEYAYKLKEGEKGFKWVPVWDVSQGEIPKGVKISFTLGEGKEAHSKIIFISQGEFGENEK